MSVSKSIRGQVQERAKSRCEYCLIPETLTHFSHQVDHIFPPRHGGTDDLDNLAWACFRCNNNKGTDIATVDFESGERVFLYNPRQHKWDDHFIINDDGLVLGKTAIGRATARLLQMNVTKRVEMRRILIKAYRWNE